MSDPKSDSGSQNSHELGVHQAARLEKLKKIEALFGVTMHERTVGKLLAELGYVRLSTRPQHPESDPAAQEAFKKLAHQEIEWVNPMGNAA